jgi:hypothetical protein
MGDGRSHRWRSGACVATTLKRIERNASGDLSEAREGTRHAARSLILRRPVHITQ